MIVTVVAIVCHLATGQAGTVGAEAPQGDCDEIVVTDSDRDPTVDLMACMVAQPALARWLDARRVDGDWLGGWRCVMTDAPYQPKTRA